MRRPSRVPGARKILVEEGATCATRPSSMSQERPANPLGGFVAPGIHGLPNSRWSLSMATASVPGRFKRKLPVDSPTGQVECVSGRRHLRIMSLTQSPYLGEVAANSEDKTVQDMELSAVEPFLRWRCIERRTTLILRFRHRRLRRISFLLMRVHFASLRSADLSFSRTSGDRPATKILALPGSWRHSRGLCPQAIANALAHFLPIVQRANEDWSRDPQCLTNGQRKNPDPPL